jgi:HAD superfamily hydrolase (TIGR01459 family)
MTAPRFPTGPKFVTGLADIAPHHDALICDVWGVLHNGHSVYPEAAAALERFRRDHGPVILLTNAPRLPQEVAEQFETFRVPHDCYDAIVTSGGAAHDALAAMARDRNASLPLYYIGPERDLPVLAGLDVRRVDIAEAEAVLCVGLRDDLVETPEDYAGELAAIAARRLPFLCANPDLVVHRGAILSWCAGALARDYAKLGGPVTYFGKPHAPVYGAALAAAAGAKAPLAIGDGLFTDVKGANDAGLDVLFIADGIHGEEVLPYTPETIAALLARSGVRADGVMRKLIW